jgi:acyl-CoA synthetase (NDP forming)
MDDAPQLSGTDRESAVVRDDKLELRVWLRLLTCSNLIESRVRAGLREDFAITLPRFDLLAQLDRAPDGLTMGELSDATVKRIEEILAAKRLDALVEVRNPIDINPGADDEAHLQISEAFLNDPSIDAVIVGLDPTAPSVRSLEHSKLRPGYDITDPNSSVHMMPQLAARTEKPLIGVIDAGRLYDAMAAALMDQGVCVFRNCARGTRALARYVEARLVADGIRKQHANT